MSFTLKNQNLKETRFACIGTVTFASKVNVTVIIMCRGENAGISNVETYRDRQ